MPIYEYNGKRYNIPEAKIEELVTRMPGAKLIEHNEPDREVTETIQQHEQQPVQQRNFLSLGQDQGGIADINRTVVYPQYKQERDDKRALKNDLAALGADLQSKIEERDKQLDKKWAKEDEGKSTARKVLERPNPYTGMMDNRVDRVRDNYQTAKRYIDEANLLVENVESGAKALKGITDEVFDPNTWLLGLDEIGKNSNVKEVVRKYENKEELTDDEDAVLDALALNMAANAFYASDLPRQYKWGQIAGESLPFMLEFILNPIAGGGKGIAKTIASRALSRFALGKGGRTAIKAGSRILGDAVGAAGMTLTSGAPRAIADAMNRNLGEATFARGETGAFEYAGHEGGVDPVKAGLEAFLASTIEYQSEMVGSAGVGKLLKKAIPMPKFATNAMGNLKASGIGRAYKGITNSNAYKEVRRTLKKGQWSGTFGEYGEELYGTAMNAIIVGDSKLSDLTDIDQQVDTFMGLAITGGVTGSVSTGAYIADRARTSYKLSKADETGSKYFQDWEQLKDQLADYSIGELADAQKDVLANKDIPKEGRRALSDYIYYSTYQQALIGANQQRHEDNKAYAETENAKRLKESIANKQSVVLPTLNKEKEQLEAELGDLVDLTYEEVANSPEATPELIEAKRRHDIVNAEYEGVMEQLKAEVDEAIAPQIKAMQDIAVDGQITELNVGTEDVQDIVYLAKGDISVNEDGTVDADNTAPILVVRDSEGKKRMVSRNKISSVKMDDLGVTVEAIRQQAYEKFVRPLADKMEGKTHFNQGEQVEYVNAKGETVAGTVVNKQNNTVTVVSVDGKKTETLTEEQLSQQLLTETIDDVKVRDVIQVEIDGEIYEANVTSIQDGEVELYIPSFPEANGRYQDVTTEELRKIRVVPQPETIKKTEEEVKSEGRVPEQVVQNDSKTPGTEAESQITPEQEAQENNTEAKKIERRRQEELKLLPGGTLLWNHYGNEGLENWIVGEKTKTRRGKDAVTLSRIDVEAEDGKTYSKEYADKNGIKYHPDNISTLAQIVPISELHDFIKAKYDAELDALDKIETEKQAQENNTEVKKADIERRRQELESSREIETLYDLRNPIVEDSKEIISKIEEANKLRKDAQEKSEQAAKETNEEKRIALYSDADRLYEKTDLLDREVKKSRDIVINNTPIKQAINSTYIIGQKLLTKIKLAAKSNEWVSSMPISKEEFTKFEDAVKKLSVKNMGEVTSNSEVIPDILLIEEINAKYDAEIESLNNQITPEQQAEQAEAEKQQFMQSLPVVESGKNKGQIDQSQMTPEQNIRYFEYQYGKEKAVQAARKMSENLTKRIKKEQEKLDNDPFNIAQNELVDQLQAQMEAYKNYAFARMQEQTERNIAEQSGPSVIQSKQQRSAGIQQEEAGRTGTVEVSIKEKWDAADKIEGIEDVITLASGEKIPGRYILTTADAPSPSHDIERNFAKTKGFPTNEQGNTVNDRDYESDKTAQVLVQQRANKYDERAVQTPVVVSADGIVLSGNDRTMAGKIAARKGTDKAYVDYITKYADRWGFTPEQVANMESPRIVFIPDAPMPYNTTTFSKFNAEEKKTQNTLEKAIKSSKSVSRDIVIPIADVIDEFKNLSNFYADSKATKKVIDVLTRNNIVQNNELPGLMDGDVLSAEGRSYLETLMLGAVLQEQALREVDVMRSVRQTLMRTMPQLVRNASLNEYTLINELNNSIHLLYQSKQSGSKVKLQLMQTNLFEASASEIYAETEKTLAFMLEEAKDTEIRAIFESYNKEAIAIESGQANMFDGLMSKPELLTLVLNNYYGRQTESTQQTKSSSQSDGESEGNRSGQPTESGSGQQQPKGQQSGSIEAEAAKETAAKPIQGLDNYTEQDVKDLVRNQIDELIRENDLDVEVVDLAVIGSRKRGDAQDTSDLDVVVEYRGDISEDGLFNILNDEAFTIDDVQVDINPIKAEKTGTLAEYLEKAKAYDEKVTAAKEEKKQKNESGPKEIDVEGLFGALRTKGEAKLSDHVKPKEDEKPQGKEAKDSIRKLGTGSNVYFDSNGIRVNDYQNGKVLMNVDSREDFGGPAFWNIEFDTPEEAVKIANELAKIYPNGVPQAVLLDRVVKDMQSKGAEVKPKPAYGANNKIITTDRYNELREQMRKKLNNLNVGFDPEVFSIGAQMAMYHIESGAHKFADFAKRMVDDLGDAIRPYLKASYEGARAMPGMEELSKTMDPYKEVQAFDVNQRFEEPINNIEQNEQGTRSTETIEAEAAVVEAASETIERESENVGSNQQRAGDVKEQADEQVKKVETLLIEVEQKLANLKLSGKNYSTDGIAADYPINVLAKGPIKKDATAYVKAVAAMTGLEHDTNSKGKAQIVSVNIAPAGGDVTFVLWSKKNPDYGVYVSVPYSPDYRNEYDNYKVDGSILWRVTTKQNKWTGLSNQYVNSDVTAQEMAETLLKGLNQELRSRGLEQEINQVEKAPETVKNKRINKKTSAKVAKNQTNMLSLFGEEDDVSPINTNQDERVLQGNSQRLHQGSRAGSGSRLHTGGTRRNSGIQSNEVPQPDGTQQRSTEREGSLLPGDADVLNTEQEKSLEDSPALVPFEADRNDVEAFNKSKKYADNIEAIRTVLTLITENRKATPDEKKILSRYVGFGGLKEVLLDPDSGNWNKSDNQYKDQVREVIELANRFDAATGSKDTFNKIRGSILNAHYTSATVIEAIYNGLKKIGFKKGNILEPSAGIGNFITYMPESIKGKSNISAVELDNLTGNILKYLHDNVAVQISGIENAVIPNNSQDLVISNVPFGNYKVYDKKFKGEKEQFLNRIHNYFFAKAIDQAREGGLIVFVTSKGVLDAPGNEAIRRYLNQNAEFLGAVRLPSNSFQKTANTQVTTDVIFLQKSKSGNSRERFIGVKEVDAIHKDGGTEKVSVNEYFINHPENMLGTIEAGGLYSRNDYSLIDNGTSKDLSKVIRSMLPENVFTPVKSAMGSQANDIKQSIEDVKEGNIVILNGSLYKKEEGVAVEIKINEPAAKIEKYIDLRNKLMGLIYSEYINIDSKELDNLRSQLNKSYDEFVKKYGKLEKSIKKIVKEDADGYNVQSLEIDGRKADIFTKRTISPIIQKTHVESIDEAIIASLSETAGIDMERISQLMGKSMAEVVQEAKGKLFEEPGGGFVTRDEYLSGNVKKKLREAKKAVEEGFTEFQYNIDELEKVIPADIPAIQIEARAGSRWIPASVYTEFAQHILKSNGIVITYSKAADQYSHNGRIGTVDATAKYGTSRVNGADILVNALHINPPKVFDYVGTGSDRKAVLNQEETDKAMQKYQLIRDTFEDWVYKSQDRRTLLGGIYNERFNTNVKRRYDGSHMNIPGINGIVLRDHQKDAIWMLLQNGGGVIDHLVGAGKTFVMVAGTMEMKRTGVVKKPMIIALKSTIPQIVESYRSAYPMAKVLAPMEKDFEKKNRMRLFSKIANNEWDCIIMSHENYGKIPHEKEIQEELINDELEQLREEEAQYKAENNRSALKGVLIRIKNLEARLDKLADISKDNSLTFEQMGIDHIMVDESQQFKNLSYLTKQRGIAGLGKAEGSKRSFNLLVGLRYLQRKNKADKGATFLSGTPITNSIVEMYSLLNYLRPNKMAELGFTSFDSWATTFANPTMDIEFTVTNNIKQKTRFREFMNVPELSMLYTEIADIRTDENLKLDKPKMKGNGYTVEEIKMNEDQIEFGKRLTKFAETKDGELIGRPPLSEKEMSAAMLLATNLSSKMAIDMRLISNEYQYNPGGKIAKLVNNVVRIFNETSEFKGTQLIFSDLGTPKSKTNKTALLKDYLEDEVGLNQDSLIELFGDYNAQGHRFPALSTVKKRMIDNLEMSEEEVEQIVLDSENSVGSFDVYNEVKFRLIEQGIPEEQIVFIHDYNTNKRKDDLFKKVNEGKIRIVLGSTQKLGTGVNVQERVSAVHHVDVPWTPASMEQRNGRAIRQGNWVAKKYLNNELPVYAYATERTLDAYKYQLLHTKQRFLNQVKSGDIEDRVLKEGDGDAESGVNYAELVAMLSGNKDILLKARLEEKVAQLKRQKRNFEGELYESIEKKKEKEDLIPIIEKNISESKENVKEITDKAVFDKDGKLVITSFNGKEYKDDVKGEKGDKDKKIETARIKVAKEAIEYAEKWLKKAKYGDKTTINIGGYDILMQADRFLTGNNRNLFDTDLSLELSLQTPNGSQYEFNLSEIPGVLLNNIQKIITDRIPDVLSRQQAVLEKTKDDIKAYDEIIKVGDKWSKQEEYDNALKELKEVNDRLDADIKKNETGTPQEESEGEENDNEDVRFRSVDEAGFYSTVEDALEKIKQEKGTPEQFKAMLLKNGAKQAELDWMDYDGTFTGKSVTKTEIQDWIDQNRIEVQEVEKGNRIKEINEKFEKKKDDWVHNVAYDAYKNGADRNKALFHAENIRNAVSSRDKDQINETAEDWEYLNKYNNPDEIDLNEIHDIEEDQENEQYAFAEDTKYSQYTLPGGENYKELLLTIPTNHKSYSLIDVKTDEVLQTSNDYEELVDRRNELGGELVVIENDESKGVTFKSDHFDEPNILAHVRFDERTVNGERVLFIEEIQSDWAQEGKKEGFKGDYKNKSLVEPRFDGKYWYLHEKGSGEMTSSQSFRTEAEAWKQIEGTMRLMDNGVPDMPFKKTDQWVNLALRRMMMYAAENGYDRIAWTTGQQQAERYDLSKQVDWIEYGKNENGTYWFALPVEYSKPSELTEKELESYVGKDITKKMIDGEGIDGELGGKRLQGNDLKVGGSGMIAFYDQIVPKAAKKLAKPFGAEVETINIRNKTFNIRRKNNGYFEVSDIDGNMVMNNVDPAKIDQWEQSDIYVQSIPITDELREMAPEGMPLFRNRDREAREAYAMREWKRAINAVTKLSNRLNVDLEILETTEGLTGKKATAKGWFNPKTGKITIVMPNHSNSWDVQSSLLHEAVGHYGLRKLFGDHFYTFLDNVYNASEKDIRDAIDNLAKKHKGNRRTATEEYLSQLAEDPMLLESDRRGGFFDRVKHFFINMLAKAGFNPGFELSNNELRYILWRSYSNLAEPGRYKSIVDHAKDIAMQDRLKVGNYADKEVSANVAEEPGAPPTRKLNKELFGRLSDAFNNAKTLDDKYDAAFEIIQGIEAVIGGNQAILAKTHEELANIVPGLSTEERQDIMDGLIDGMHTMGEVFLDIEAIDSAGNLISTWFHENAHRITRNVFSDNELEQFIDSINPDYKHLDMLLPESYRDGEKDMQGSEFIARAVEYVLTENSLEDVANNNIDYGTMPDKLRNFVEQVFNNLHDEQSQKSRINTGETRNRGLSSRISNDNRGTRQGNSKEDSGIFENFRTGAYLKQRALENNDGSTEGIEERVNDLFENADNLKKSIPNYPGFLNDVLQGSPAKSDIIANAREKGFTSMPKAIEEYLANVEDPAELSRIKELLGVDMPDNALRYMLWRNANPDDGTVVWKAKEAVKTNELDENILFRKGEVPSSIKNDKYEKRISSRHNRGFRSLMYGIEEGWLDRMASLRIIQDAITGGKAIPDRANAYMLENQLTSRNTADIRYFTKNLVDPFVKQIHDIFGRNMNAADEYMNAKHGLERNDLMAEEEAKRKYAKNIASLNKEYADEKIDEDTYNEKIEAINGKIEAYAEKLKEEKDYSGLTAIAAERGREDFKAVAQEIVAEIEGGVPKEDIDALWSRVNSATKWILDKQYNAGIMTKDIYEKIRGMYKYYVPLRGFEEVTATDLYEYIDNSPSNFEGTVKKAYGRTSKAESPTATIMSMGESGIMQANRNRMKQAFYRLVATNPSNYASIEDVWFVETADGFEERFPDISPSASADEVLEAIADFNNEMAELAAEGKAFQGRNKLDIGVKIMKAQASEHVIRVWIAGEEKVIFINGNPRAAQAINGLVQKDLLNKDNLRHGVHYWSRQMAANFTSRNPAFMVTNLMRDVQFAVVSAAVKEGVPYSTKLAKNVFLVGKTISANVFKDGNKDNAEFQKYWEEFEANGGETGYANLHSIDFNRKYVNKKLREFSDQRDFLKPFRAYVQFMENGNRMIEDMSRFATYVTSRQMGRSIERACVAKQTNTPL